MPSIRQPRSGSMQYWPRKRAKKGYARVRHAPQIKEPGLLGFAGYKVGMTHVSAIETGKYSHKKGEEVSVPVTVLECPPMKIASVRFYSKTQKGLVLKKEIAFPSKDLEKRTNLPKKSDSGELDKVKPEEYEDIRVLIYTIPKKTSIGKKKPEIFEVALGGTNDEKVKYVKENKEKEITVNSLFKEGDLTDLRAVTKGKGFQGPVKRYGISIRQAKSEKSIRNPGSLGGWQAQGHVMYRIAYAGKMGYHQRTEYNKQILKIIEDPKEINPAGGWHKYGEVRSESILIKGSVAGAKKRLIIFQRPLRPMKRVPEVPTIQQIMLNEQDN